MYSFTAENNSINHKNLYVHRRIEGAKIFLNETPFIYDVSVILINSNLRYVLNGEVSPELQLLRGRKYIFKLDSPSNIDYPLRFYRNINRYSLIDNSDKIANQLKITWIFLLILV